MINYLINMKKEDGTMHKMDEEYSKVAVLQKMWNTRAAEILSEAVRKQFEKDPKKLEKTEPYVIADLGCFDGLNSVPVLKSIIETIRGFSAMKNIVVYLEDTPQCNMTKAITTVTEKMPENVYVYTIAKSFYDSLFSPGTCDLIYCITSLHMISEPAPSIHDYWYCYLTTKKIEGMGGEKWDSLARRDWENFLLNREKELKSKGLLYVSTFTTNDEDSIQFQYLLDIQKALKNSFKKVLEKHGLQAHELALTIGSCCRKFEHYEEPIKKGLSHMKVISSEVKGYKNPGHIKIKENYMEGLADLERLCETYFRARYTAILSQRGVEASVIEKFWTDFKSAFARAEAEILRDIKEDFINSMIAVVFEKEKSSSILSD